jgi:hypothetical protein
MRNAIRVVLPELLDDLPADDPQAQRSRRDLQRIHRVMRTRHTLQRAVEQLQLQRPPQRILELGGGDGTVMLKFAKRLATQWPGVELTLLDRQDLLSRPTREGFQALGWRVSVLTTDVLDWARAAHPARYDLCVTTLFLHHFDAPALRDILRTVAASTDAFVACEPRRDLWAHIGSRLVGLLGSNRVTRADAVTSVAAGFAGDELTEAWPRSGSDWALTESRAFPFSHLFLAQKRARDDAVPA